MSKLFIIFVWGVLVSRLFYLQIFTDHQYKDSYSYVTQGYYKKICVTFNLGQRANLKFGLEAMYDPRISCEYLVKNIMKRKYNKTMVMKNPDQVGMKWLQ